MILKDIPIYLNFIEPFIDKHDNHFKFVYIVLINYWLSFAIPKYIDLST